MVIPPLRGRKYTGIAQVMGSNRVQAIMFQDTFSKLFYSQPQYPLFFSLSSGVQYVSFTYSYFIIAIIPNPYKPHINFPAFSCSEPHSLEDHHYEYASKYRRGYGQLGCHGNDSVTLSERR